MTTAQFVDKLKDIALNYKTLYVMGCFGAPMNEENKKRLINHHEYNAKPERVEKINEATSDTFGYDCSCLIKGVLWGWNGDVNANDGGAIYKSNNVPDIDADKMIEVALDVSDDFTDIEVGEITWLKDHVGIYIGDGLCIECSPKWSDGVQITACNTDVEGYNRRDWKLHGRLPFVE